MNQNPYFVWFFLKNGYLGLLEGPNLTPIKIRLIVERLSKTYKLYFENSSHRCEISVKPNTYHPQWIGTNVRKTRG